MMRTVPVQQSSNRDCSPFIQLDMSALVRLSEIGELVDHIAPRTLGFIMLGDDELGLSHVAYVGWIQIHLVEPFLGFVVDGVKNIL